MFLAMLVHRGFKAQLLIYSVVELCTEVGNLLDERLQHRGVEYEEYRVSHRTYAHRRVGGTEQVCLTKVFACSQQSDTQFLPMRASADDLSLSTCYNEETLFVFPLLHKILATCHFHWHKIPCQPCHNLLIDILEEWNGTEVLGCKTGHSAQVLNLDAFCFLQFHLGTVDTIGAALHLSPRKKFEKKSRCDTAHLRGRFGCVRQFASRCSRNAALNVVVCHN